MSLFFDTSHALSQMWTVEDWIVVEASGGAEVGNCTFKFGAPVCEN